MLTRRGFLAGTLATAACGRGPTILSKPPAITHGVQCGDVQTTARGATAIVWARCSEPARMLVEWDPSPTFANPRRVEGPVVGPDRDHAGSVVLTGLPADQTISYRVRFERVAERGASIWASGRFATPRSDRLRIAWTGDTCGQGFGRNPEWGGLKGYAALRAAEPHLFINSGDLIYADNPILAEQDAGGRVWRNLTTERIARVAESLDDFRARFAYNLEDEHLRGFAGEVSTIVQWDDHETHNNWWPGQELADERYRERDASRLAARALTALREWTPIPAGPVHRVIHHGPLLDVIVLDCRSFRTPNDPGLASGSMLGAQQARWLVDTLAASRARWKIVACDQPVALVIPDDDRVEGFAAGTRELAGREPEFATVLTGLHAANVKNVVWITADVHYAAAHHFDPARGTAGVAFTPFWEFIAGPIHAGTFGPNPLDPTFGPEVRFQWAPQPGQENLAPWDGLQSFGTIDVSRDALGVTLWGIDGKARHEVEIAFT